MVVEQQNRQFWQNWSYRPYRRNHPYRRTLSDRQIRPDQWNQWNQDWQNRPDW